MAKLEKIYLLDDILQNRRTPASAAYLMERLECSSATLYRLIGELRDQFNAPIISKKGFFYDPSAQFSLPGVRLNMEETNGLLMAAQILEDLQSDALNQSLSRIIGNIEKVLEDKGLNNRKLVKIIPALSRKPNSDTFQMVLNALSQGKKLNISYQGRQQTKATKRLVSPQRFTSYKNAWYLDAYCHLRHDIRLFALENVQSCEIDIEPSKTLSEDTLRNHYAHSYGIFAGEAKHTATIEFNTALAPWVESIHWHSAQTVQRLDDTHILMTLPYNKSDELIADILHFGPAAKVISPEPLKQQVKDTLTAACQQYKTT
ncbi:helix-turn-helix transcriptional regulator [Marinicella rhabdoformis]|uniref:helix-turn-helix transcriptional regulator n=1 Tax=Marinicella rhabdoformis TaxID=2580566 RepID=UPI0012AED7AD|nr:WYL domain-containing protein [Marinicella rhabdoformis]